MRARLQNALEAAVEGHELITRVALAMVLVRLELQHEVLATLARLPTDEFLQADASLRSALSQVLFARGSALLALGDRARAGLQVEHLRALVKEHMPSDPEALLVLRELEHAVR